ncbi:ATP-binding protein [Ancylobacter sp. FA202]|uniref:ATP-binding protein n=1 Tax=Ancylobacter sp. FA202 TaxID=1111106 RepID=UPI00037C7EA3|nr:ATP-binding protein [Ancylobacter sp. FA202]
MSETTPIKRPLHLQTIDSLFADLIGGASISVDESGTEFSLTNVDSPAVLNWYRLNRSKWAGNVMTVDVEAMVASVLTKPSVPQPPAPTAAKAGRRLRLAKIVAHRFAGVHAYGTAETPPVDFVFEPREPITLFDGWNGAGKTSLLNTVVWCLTGEILRPQRRPESGQEEFDGLFVRDVNGNDETSSHALTPITPLPDPKYYVPPVGKPVHIDSWVELTFIDQDGQPVAPVRRTQLRGPRGKITETLSGFDTLGVDPIALRIGTTMPALLQYIKVGSPSDLGEAAAKLTGLADVASLAKHAAKSREKLNGDLKKDRTKEIDAADSRFMEALGDLQKQIDEFPTMLPPDPLPTPSDAKDVESKIEALVQHFDTLKTSALADAQTILGKGFDPTSKAARDGLEAGIGPAQGQLKSLGQLASVKRVRDLAELTPSDWHTVDALVQQIRAEGAVLAELTATPALSRRKTLYARVAGWMAEGDDHDPAACVVCSRSLDGVLDPVTQKSVSQHLSEVTESEQALLALSIQRWAANWGGALTSKSHEALQPELRRDLPGHPGDLIRAALTQELFETVAFQGTLAALKPGVAALCDKHLPNLPPFIEPVVEALPADLGAAGVALTETMQRLVRAEAFAKWRDAHQSAVADVTLAILKGTGGPVATVVDTTPIAQKLEALNSIVKGVAPLNTALDLCARLTTQLNARRLKEDHLALYARAADALEGITKLGSLAERQVDTLRRKLHARTTYWRDRCYRNSFPMAGHALRDTAMDAKGVLDIHIGFEKATAPAQHISNASALRANLMGFYLAFWEHVLTERGGITTLIFDDPQELLDLDNREKLARLIPELVGAGGQLLIATYDRNFARMTVAAGRTYARIEHRSVHPVNSSRPMVGTAAALEDLDRKRDAYLEDKDNASMAQDYANEVRIFLEARLADLFDDPAYPAYAASSKNPTLADHLGHLRSLVNQPPNALFRGKATKAFCECKALAQGAECLRVLNTSHHNKASLSAGDIFAVAEQLDVVRALAERMHVEFRHWRWSEPIQSQDRATNVVPFKSVSAPQIKVVIHPDLAAFSTHAPDGFTQDSETDWFDASWFGDKAFFYIRKNNLGFSVPDGCIAIVECTPYDGRDHNLVIARQKGHLLARRLFRPANSAEIALAAEAPDPRESKPTLVFNAHDVVLHRIVGMLTERPVPPVGKGEATEITATSLSHVKSAYRVREESGVPLALPGQVVLGGDIVPKEQLAHMEGALVALCLDNGSSVFKRIGQRVPGTQGKLWQFESVGGLGSSLVISLAEDDGANEVPRFLSARQVIGVLYTV